MALLSFFYYDRMTVSIMVCWALKSPAVRAALTYPFPSMCTRKKGTAPPESSLCRLKRQTSVPNPRQRANKVWPKLQQFSKDLKPTLLLTEVWGRLVHCTNKHQSALELLPQGARHGWHIFCVACKAAGTSLCCWCILFPVSHHVFLSHLLLKLKRRTAHT